MKTTIPCRLSLTWLRKSMVRVSFVEALVYTCNASSGEQSVLIVHILMTTTVTQT